MIEIYLLYSFQVFILNPGQKIYFLYEPSKSEDQNYILHGLSIMDNGYILCNLFTVSTLKYFCKHFTSHLNADAVEG